MRASSLALALTLGCTATLALPSLHVHQRSSNSVGQIFAYGSNLTGLPLFYSDGAAYIGNVVPSNASVATNVTFALSDTALVATPLNSNATTNWKSPSLAIDTASGAIKEAIFTSTSEDDYTEKGFIVYGTLITWENSLGLLESSWFAEETDTEGLWILKWTADNAVADSDSGVSVALKNLAPTTT